MTKAKDPATSNRDALLARRRQLIEQVLRVDDALDWFQSNIEPELLEEGQEQALALVLERLDAHDRAEVDAIDRALARVDRGEYGICAACGAAIPRARQQALPTADLCRPCAEKRDAEARR